MVAGIGLLTHRLLLDTLENKTASLTQTVNASTGLVPAGAGQKWTSRLRDMGSLPGLCVTTSAERGNETVDSGKSEQFRSASENMSKSTAPSCRYPENGKRCSGLSDLHLTPEEPSKIRFMEERSWPVVASSDLQS